MGYVVIVWDNIANECLRVSGHCANYMRAQQVKQRYNFALVGKPGDYTVYIDSLSFPSARRLNSH